MKTTQALKTLIPALALTFAAGLGTAHAQELVPAPQASSTQSRDQVRADLLAWHESGLADAWRGEQTPDIEAPAYRAEHQRYLALTGKQSVQTAATQPSREGRGG